MTEFFPMTEPQNLESITEPQNFQNPPIILIPGVCGSLLVADNNEVAWLNETLTPYPQASVKLMQYLYGARDPLTNEFVSFVERQGFSTIKAVPGLPGCSKLLNHKLTKLPGIVHKKLGVYYETFAAYLVKNFQYKENVNLFAFTYDWRQPLHAKSIQQPFDALLKHVCSQSNMRCIVVGHSMGGLLVTTYMRLHKEWNTYIAKFVSLGVPYAGSGASGLIAAPYGYNLRMPFRPRVARGIQGPGGSMACLNLPAIDTLFRSCLFLRLAQTSQPLSMAAIHTAAIYPEQLPTGPSSSSLNKQLKLNRQAYKNKIPDIPALLLMEIENAPECIGENFEQVITMLARYCEPGFVVYPPIKLSKEKYVPLEVALDNQDPPCEPVNELPPEAKVMWQWAVYSPGMDIYPRAVPVHGFADITSMQEDEQNAENTEELDYGTILRESKLPALRTIVGRASLRDQNLSLRSIILQHCLSEVGTGRTMISQPQRHVQAQYKDLDNLDSLLSTDSVGTTPSIITTQATQSNPDAYYSYHVNPLQSSLGSVPISNPLTNTLLDGPSKVVQDSVRESTNTHQSVVQPGAEYIDDQTGDGTKTENFITSVDRAFGSPHFYYKSHLQSKDNFKKMIIIVKDMISQYKSNFRQHTDNTNRSTTPSSIQSTSMTNVVSDQSLTSGSTTSNRFLYRPVSTLDFREMGGPEIQEQYSYRCTALLEETKVKPYADLLSNCVKPRTLDSLIYKPSLEYWEQSKELLLTPIVFPEDTELFRFYSLNGSNLQTAIHAYYDEILSSLYELAYRKPKFIFGIGDGTVPLASSLSDPIPNRYVDDRVAFPQMGHFEMLQSEEIFALLVSFMGLKSVNGVRKPNKS